MTDSRIPGCWKYGCVGCLTLCALAVAAIFVLSAVQLTREPEDPRPEESRRSHQLPEPPAPPAAPYPPAPGEPSAVPELAPLPAEMPPEARIGRVVLDLTMANVTVRPGPAGEPIRVDADYDAGAFELREDFTEDENGGWTYEIRFRGRSGFLGVLMRGGVESGDNRIEIIIPRGHPLDLVGKLGIGESEIDLGGLWLRDVDLDLGTGEHFLEFREPLPFPMSSFRLDASVGELEVRKLGEASPRRVEISQRVGELFLDLQGAWRQDAEITVEAGIGEARVWLPENARVEIERAQVAIGESSIDRPLETPLPEGAPTLTLDLESKIGEITVEY